MLQDKPHSLEERSALLKSIVFVNRTWLALVAPIASRDVHVSNERNACAFLGLLPKRSLYSDLFIREATHLSIDYSFTTPAWAPALNESGMVARWSRRRKYPLAPSVRRLSLSGVTTVFVVTMLPVCPHVETVENTHPAGLDALAPLLPAVRTLVLRYPGVAVSRKMMVSWNLSAALEDGLFPEGKCKKPRVVVRSGTPEADSFIALRRSCKGFNVELVYERDDARSPSC
ncbi:hypothetical protein LXA43DRAFT_1067632 [Ganoderma leucocontextum]|nr:hypothetical protein LXA43DRAFT_1067632 [Ganoderma leucocontextum]